MGYNYDPTQQAGYPYGNSQPTQYGSAPPPPYQSPPLPKGPRNKGIMVLLTMLILLVIAVPFVIVALARSGVLTPPATAVTTNPTATIQATAQPQVTSTPLPPTPTACSY
jgi:hypothetical protein